MIREATEADLPRIVAMGERFHAFSDYGFAAYDGAAAAQFVAGLIANPGGVALVSDHGMLGGMLVPLYFAPAHLVAVETFWWADRDGMALLDAFEQWAKAKSASAVTLSCLGNKRDKALGRVFEHRGYAKAETSYMRAL